MRTGCFRMFTDRAPTMPLTAVRCNALLCDYLRSHLLNQRPSQSLLLCLVEAGRVSQLVVRLWEEALALSGFMGSREDD